MAFSRSVKHPQRLMRMLSCKVTGASGALTEGQFDMSIVKNGTGDYTLTFNEAFARIPMVCANSRSASHVIQVVPSKTNVQLLAKTDAGVAADSNLDVIILGADSADQI